MLYFYISQEYELTENVTIMLLALILIRSLINESARSKFFFYKKKNINLLFLRLLQM